MKTKMNYFMKKKLDNLSSFLKKKIAKKNIKIGIIGLGYTGLPLAIQIRKKSFVTFGFDVDKKKISNLKKKYLILIGLKMLI